VIINAPMSYAGSAQRIMRLRRRARRNATKSAVTVLAVLLVILAWVLVTVWYLVWGFWLVPYRLLRRAARKRKAEALRHRELMGTIQGAASASAAAIVAATAAETLRGSVEPAPQPHLRVDAHEREQAASTLNAHYVAGRLTEDELHERLGVAYSARTRGDLAGVLGDLPALTSGPPGSSVAR